MLITRLNQLSKFGVFILVLVISLFGCGQDAYVDRSFLTGEPCVAPCWQGLTPGYSSLEDVLDTLDTVQHIDSTSILKREAYWLESENSYLITFDCKYRSPLTAGCGSLIISGGILYSVETYVAYNLRVGDMASKLGNPDYVSLFMEINGCRVSVIWSQRGIVGTSYQESQCASFNSPGSEGMLNPQLEITTLIYSVSEDADDEPCESCIPWRGFIDG